MLSVARLTIFLAIFLPLILFSQPVLSQTQNPDLQQGIAEYNQENFEEAIDSLLKARNADIQSSLPAYYLGMTYKNLQDYNEAKKFLRAAIDLRPEIKEAILELAEVHYQLGEFEEAHDLLMTAEKGNVRPGQTAYMKGLVLLEMNENLDAVEAFENARALSPELVQAADYQIGQAYLKESGAADTDDERFKSLDEAEKRFQSVIDKGPDTDMAAFAKNFLDLIAKKKQEPRNIRAYLGVHLQYDDNVVLAPGDESAATNITDEDDSRVVITGGIEYIPVKRRPLDYSAHYSLYISNHDKLASHDVMSHSFALFPSRIISNNSKIGVALRYNHTWVDDDEYLGMATFTPTYTYNVGRNNTIQTYLSYGQKDFLTDTSAGDEDRDADVYSGSVSWFSFFKQDSGVLVPFMESFELSAFGENEGYLNILYELSKEETDGRNWEYIGNKMALIYLIPLLQNAKLRLAGDIMHKNFTNVHTVFGKEREDFIYGFSSLLFYKFRENLNLQLLYSYRRDDSNIGLYDYDRNMYSIGLEWRYQ
jgi:tetratricopeptide (TPR) repeat protein